MGIMNRKAANYTSRYEYRSETSRPSGRRGKAGRGDGDGIALCFRILSFAAAIDRDCATRVAPWGLSESKSVLLFLLHGLA